MTEKTNAKKPKSQSVKKEIQKTKDEILGIVKKGLEPKATWESLKSYAKKPSHDLFIVYEGEHRTIRVPFSLIRFNMDKRYGKDMGPFYFSFEILAHDKKIKNALLEIFTQFEAI